MDDKFKKGAPGSEERGNTGYGAGEVRGSRDLTDSERGQLLSGYTTAGEDHGLDERREASSFDRGAQSGAGYNVGGPTEIGGGVTAGATDTRAAGEFSGSIGTGPTYGMAGSGIGDVDSPIGAGSSGIGVQGSGSSSSSSKASEAKEKVSGATAKVKSVAGEHAHKVADKAKHQVDARKGQVADKIDEASSQLHDKLSGKADEYVEQVASFADQYLSRASTMLRERNSDELAAMARDEFRSRPLAVAAGFFALGFLGARLLRS